MMKNFKKVLAVLCFALAALFASVCAPGEEAFAKGPLDEILKYEVTVDVNQDATLNMLYHIDWKVLDSTSEGPLSWVQIGVPNSHVISYEPLSSNIKKMSITTSSGSLAKITFDRDYKAGEVVSFDFLIVQDYMYESYTEGKVHYSFTPGWFDDIAVDELTVKWNSEKVDSFIPSCKMGKGYLKWSTSLAAGETFDVDVYYPESAYSFDLEKYCDDAYQNHDYSDGSDYYYDDDDDGDAILGLIAIVFFVYIFIWLPIKFIKWVAYQAGRGFGAATDKKITRTKVTYYSTCPGCGAARGEGEKVCSYCGRSFVKSEETIKDDEAQKNFGKYNTAGEYRYSSDPNVFVRVNVVRIPRPPRPPRSSSSGGYHSSHHSSCAHSSCACACACACAGGGRAGCTNKDFYNTGLKLSELKKRAGKTK